MAVYNVEAVNEALNNNEPSIIDSLEEACDYMMSVLEGDRVLKNEKTWHEKHGPEDYEEYSTEDLKDEFAARRKFSQKSKEDREDENRYSSALKFGGKTVADPTVISASNRTKGQAIGKELAKRGIDPKTINKYGKENLDDNVAKKRAIKETCLHILSILDDIE